MIALELTYPQGIMLQMADNRVAFPLFVGGYGCGKSEILAINAVRDVMEFPGCKVGCYAPTHDLLGLNLIPRIESRLEEQGLAHTHNKSKHILHIQGDRQIIFRSMDNPARIVAYEVYRSHVDEADLMATARKGEESWNRVIARNRQKRLTLDGKKHKDSFNMVSGYTTPEGYKFTYRRWKKAPGTGYKYVTAPTSSNWNLDESFIHNLEDTYTPEQCKAYLLGMWTNIFTGSVYSYFDRDRHNTDRIIKPKEPLIIGADFNYGGSCGSVYVPRSAQVMETDHYGVEHSVVKAVGLQMVDEFISHDTEGMVRHIRENYDNHHITIVPDATGVKNSTNASMSDIAILKEAQFQIKAKSINPRIVDRINSVQRLLYNKLFTINVAKCPKTTEAMEEHAYSDITGLPEKIAGPGTVDDRNDSMGYPSAFYHPIKKRNTTKMEI